MTDPTGLRAEAQRKIDAFADETWIDATGTQHDYAPHVLLHALNIASGVQALRWIEDGMPPAPDGIDLAAHPVVTR